MDAPSAARTGRILTITRTIDMLDRELKVCQIPRMQHVNTESVSP
jgi:hypothetical protein